MQVSGAPSATPAPGAPVPDGAVRIAVVTHGPASSKFWAIIRNGVDSAARRLDVLVDYQSPDVFSVERMSELIDQAVATKPDGLVVSIPSSRASRRRSGARCRPASRSSRSTPAATSSGALGVLAHVGQVEDRAGLEAGPAARRRGRAARALPQPGGRQHRASTRAATGLARAMREAGGRARVLPIVDDDPRTPSLIARGRRVRRRRRRARHQLARRPGRGQGRSRARGVKIGTFDLGPDVLKAVEAGQIGFAVDQQAYLQGYLPIEMLALRARYGILPSQHDVVATGPNFVTRDNAAQALELSERSIR